MPMCIPHRLVSDRLHVLPMLELTVLFISAMPFVLGLYALRVLERRRDDRSDDPPPPQPDPPPPVLPPTPPPHARPVRTDREPSPTRSAPVEGRRATPSAPVR